MVSAQYFAHINSYTYNDFRTANKHVLIANKAILVIHHNKNVTKLNYIKCGKENKPLRG